MVGSFIEKKDKNICFFPEQDKSNAHISNILA